MIFMLQNLLHYTGDYMSKADSVLTSDFYPEQNLNFLNKLLFIPYRDENTVNLYFRLCIHKSQHPEFTGRSGYPDNFTKVLRFDLGEPYKAILVDKNNYIIVADTRELLKYTVYPGYEYDSYRGFSEAEMNMTHDWGTFNEEYNNEKIWTVHVQNGSFLAQPAYVEYFKDLFTDKTSIIAPDSYDPTLPDARRQSDKLNTPYRATERGYVIRADENGNEAEIVVMVENPETHIRKYILGSEAYFYINTEEAHGTIERLNLWQSV